MNRILSFFLCLSGCCVSQNFNAGPIIGINTSQVSFDNLAGFNKIGLRMGAFVNRNFNKFDGQIELQYINKGSREKIQNNTYHQGYRFQLTYIEIPISIKKTIYKNMDTELGGSIGYLLNWREEYDGIENYGVQMNKIEYSLHIGFEYKIRNNLYFNTRLSNSIVPIRPHPSGQTWRWNKGQYSTSISFVIYYYILKK